MEALKAEPNSQISLCAATIDHDLRAESADEARHVAALCKSLGIAHVIHVWRDPKPKTGIMVAAREARYELLADAAAELGANLIVTAHTLDDQRETRAMRGARSDNPSTGIADAVLFERRVWIARPFLSCLRADIRAFSRPAQCLGSMIQAMRILNMSACERARHWPVRAPRRQKLTAPRSAWSFHGRRPYGSAVILPFRAKDWAAWREMDLRRPWTCSVMRSAVLRPFSADSALRQAACRWIAFSVS
ncbi:tRNA lysidine(34) synthetase TilS [Rhizobium yanglingense]